jgi:Tfp pilus assembly protein PilW
MVLAEAMIASAIGVFIMAGVMTTYVLSLRGFAAMSNYSKLHADGRIAVNYFAKDIRAVTNITSYSSSSNITVAIPATFSSAGAVTSTKTVNYYFSKGALYRYDSSTLKTDMLATNINRVTFTLYDRTGSTNGVALSSAKGVQMDVSLRTSIGSRIQSEDYLSARYDMRNAAN